MGSSAMLRCDRSPSEWFAAAVHCYVEGHQSCAWCGGAHCVFHTQRGGRREFNCRDCEFHVGYDATSNQYFSYPGAEPGGLTPETMFEAEPL
jgi:hypothetical protein